MWQPQREAEIAMHVFIGVEAGKCLGMRRIFAQISPNLPELF